MTKTSTPLVIEDDIPLPPATRGKGAAANPNGVSGTLRRMKAGQSVMLENMASLKTARAAARNYKIQIAARRQPDGRVRVWVLDNPLIKEG